MKTKTPPNSKTEPTPIELRTYPVKVISDLLRIAPRQVQQLAQDGIIPRDSRGRYQLKAAVNGYVSYLQKRSASGRPPSIPDGSSLLDYRTEKARLTKLQADKAQLELDERKGELVEVEEVIDEWTRTITNCRNRLLSIPSKAAPIVASLDKPGEVMRVIDDLVREALEELADGAGLVDVGQSCIATNEQGDD